MNKRSDNYLKDIESNKVRDSWSSEIDKVRLVHLNEIAKVDPQLAEIGNVVLYSIVEAAPYDRDRCWNSHVKTSHIVRDLSHSHNLWLYRVNQLKQIRTLYIQIETHVQQMDRLIDRFYDIFIRPKPCEFKSAL